LGLEPELRRKQDVKVIEITSSKSLMQFIACAWVNSLRGAAEPRKRFRKS